MLLCPRLAHYCNRWPRYTSIGLRCIPDQPCHTWIHPVLCSLPDWLPSSVALALGLKKDISPAHSKQIYVLKSIVRCNLFNKTRYICTKHYLYVHRWKSYSYYNNRASSLKILIYFNWYNYELNYWLIWFEHILLHIYITYTKGLNSCSDNLRGSHLI